jgi:hypothetical protein
MAPWELTPEPAPDTATFAASGDFMAQVLAMADSQLAEILARLARLEEREQ